jgi:hypothetical protein
LTLGRVDITSLQFVASFFLSALPSESKIWEEGKEDSMKVKK